MPFSRSCRFAAAAFVLLAPAASRAEQNRLLPFWGQPFPSGFTRGEIASDGRARDCPTELRGTGPRHRPAYRFARCPVVLHARD